MLMPRYYAHDIQLFYYACNIQLFNYADDTQRIPRSTIHTAVLYVANIQLFHMPMIYCTAGLFWQ